jgi:protein TonB
VVLPAKVEPKPKPKPKKKKQKKAPRTTAPQSSQAQRADRAAAPTEGMASSMSPASWKGALMAHLNRHKRFPSGAGTGVVSVAFTIDRSGRVLSARLVRSSGDGMLDAEAVSLPRRASPVPAPPPNIGGSSITLAVPIRFNR